MSKRINLTMTEATKGKCIVEGCTRTVYVSIPKADRGYRNACLCKYHSEYERGYSWENSRRVGKLASDGLTYSIECESMVESIEARIEMLDMGFEPTSDISVRVEYKSPIYQGRKAMVKHLETIARLNDIGLLKTNDANCGMHCHVGCDGIINRDFNRVVARFMGSLFGEVQEAMNETSEDDRVKFFGSDFRYYAQRLDFEMSADYLLNNHPQWVNLEHDYSIEYRIGRFINYEQYRTLVNFYHDITVIIREFVVDKFVDHSNLTGIERQARIEENRKQAKKCGKRIAKVYAKYINAMQNGVRMISK